MLSPTLTAWAQALNDMGRRLVTLLTGQEFYLWKKRKGSKERK